MIYDCLIHTADRKFVVAKPEGWAWTDSERTAPFEIVTVELSPSVNDVNVQLDVSWGVLTAKLSQIDSNRVLAEFL